MSQSKLQVYTAEANPVLESFFNELLGQECTFKLEAASASTIESITAKSATAFSIAGTPEGTQPFIVTLASEWIPVISNAMVGREMGPEEEGVFDLTGQIISQGYKKIVADMSAAASLPALDVSAFPPGAWEPAEGMQGAYTQFPFTLQVADQSLSGELFIAESVAAELEAQAPAAKAPAPQAAQESAAADPVGVATPQFPDFGRENVDAAASTPGNFDLLAEVELNITVELGRRKIPLSEVLKLTSGSVIELEKLVGEPLEIFANGRLIAEGEAVVIEEQFGVRITNLATNKLKARVFA